MNETLKFVERDKTRKINMGLQNQLSDVSSESILIVTVVLIAKTLRYLQSLLSAILHTLSIISPPACIDRLDSDNSTVLNDEEVRFGSGLASLIVLCEQLNLNRIFSHPVGSDEVVTDCVVCLNQPVEGDNVRELECRHVFHKDCFDGWLDHLNFNCPICRAPVAREGSVGYTQRRVTGDLLTWFSFQ